MNHIELLKAFDVKEPLPDSLIEFNSEPLFDLDEDISLVILSYFLYGLVLKA